MTVMVALLVPRCARRGAHSREACTFRATARGMSIADASGVCESDGFGKRVKFAGRR